MIVITSKSDARKLNVAVGTIMDEADASEYIVKSAAKAAEPLTDEQRERIERSAAEDLALAGRMRERVASGRLPF